MSQGTGKVNKAKEIAITTKGTLIITRRVFDIISQMHIAAVNKEWSGIFWYKIVSGSINDPSTLVCRAIDITPMNIGSGAYTEFDYNLNDAYVMKFMDKMINDPSLIIGNIHSHNSMPCFFSGTDKDDLETNSKTNAGYLSFIVNYKHDIEKDWCAKIGIFGQEEVKGTITTRKNYNRTLSFNSWDASKVVPVDESVDEAVLTTIDILQTIDMKIERAAEDDWSDVDRALQLQTVVGYTSDGKKGLGSVINLNASNAALHNNHGITRTDFSKPITTSKVNKTEELKSRDLKGGIFKEDNILEFVYEIIEGVSKVQFVNDVRYLPTAAERKRAFKYLKEMDSEELDQLKSDLEMFEASVDKYVKEKTLVGHVYPRLVPNDYALFAKLVIYLLVDANVQLHYVGFKTIVSALKQYTENYVPMSVDAISFLTRFHNTEIARFNNFSVDVEVDEELYPEIWN